MIAIINKFAGYHKEYIPKKCKMIIKSPAKINLFLYVTGRRDNGYHDLFTLMSCVDLYDEIELTFNQPDTYVLCNNPEIPINESNLAFKAVTLFNKYFIAEKSFNSSILNGVKIDIKKNIPVGAGLGGGSSNAASVLKAVNKFYGNPFSLDDLMKMGLELGADVPFFVLGRSAIAQGIGEKLTPLPLKNSIYILLFYPGFSSSTADVYKNLDLALTKSVKFNINCHSKIFEAFSSRLNEKSINELLHNDLELPACRLSQELLLFKKELINTLAEKVLMTGSGSTFFSLFFDYKKAEKFFNELSEKWRDTDKRIFLASFLKS